MTIEDAIYSILTTSLGLDALVSGRIYPVKLPQAPLYPCISYLRISTQRLSAMGSDTPVVQARFQFSAWDKKHSDALAVAVQIRAAIKRYRGIEQGVTIQDVLQENELDQYEPNLGLYQIIQDFMIIYEE